MAGETAQGQDLAAPSSERLLKEMQFSTRNGHPRALRRQQQQRAQRRARQKPQQTAGETGAQALLFGLGSGSWRGQTAMLS